ncbi:MAG: hypothetical protein C0484_03165 [Rhodospirillum sp.]|nr:hypothetical protein [Rhodospirillum sp.]
MSLFSPPLSVSPPPPPSRVSLPLPPVRPFVDMLPTSVSDRSLPDALKAPPKVPSLRTST